MQPFHLSVIALAALLGTPVLAQNAQNQAQPEGADIQVQQPAPQVTVEQPAPDIQVQQPQPQVTVEQPQPEVTVQQPQPEVTVEQAQPNVTVEQPNPEVTVQQQGEPQVTVEQQGQADVNVTEPGQANAEQGQQLQTTDPATTTAAQPERNATSNPIYGMTGQELIGQTVYGANGENIGEIDNVVVGREANQGPAAIVGVGGFLGIGERDVPVPLESVQLEGDRLTTRLTRDQIGEMPAYDETGWSTWDQDRPFNEAMNR